jgi:hypothetical protein
MENKAGGMSAAKTLRRWAILVSAAVIVGLVVGLVVRMLLKSDSAPSVVVPRLVTDGTEAQHSPAVQATEKPTPQWPSDPPPDGFPLPSLDGAGAEFNFESADAGVRVWLPAPARDWCGRNVKCYGTLLAEKRLFAVSWFDLYSTETVSQELPTIGSPRGAKEAPIGASFMLANQYPAIAHEFRDNRQRCKLVLTFARDQRIFQLRASIPDLGERPTDVVRFIESFHFVGDETQ